MKIIRVKNPDTVLIEKIETFTAGSSFPGYFHSYAHYLGARANPSTFPEFFIAFHSNEIVGLALVVTHCASGIVLRHLTHRAVLYGAPIARSDDAEKKIIAHILEYVKKKHLFLQFRINNDAYPLLRSFNGTFDIQDYLNVFIHNEGSNKAWRSLSRSKRWQVKKSLEAGADISEAASDSDVDQWYKILKRLYDFKIKKPVPPKRFFEALLHAKTSTNSTVLLVIKYQQKVIGGILMPLSGNVAVHEWYVCGMDEKYKSKNIYPSVMATWGAIDYTIQNNFEYFDFMGAGRPHIPYGVREFKERFGGELVNVVRYTHFPDNIYASLFRKLNWL